MGTFKDTLRFLGLTELNATTGKTCTLWRGVERSAFSSRPVSLLQIRQYQSRPSLIDELRALPHKVDSAVVTTRSKIEPIAAALKEMRLPSPITERSMLYESAKSLFLERNDPKLPKLIVEPRLVDYSDNKEKVGVRPVINWIQGDNNERLAIVTGNAGFGKTTFSIRLCEDILRQGSLFMIPIYVGSEHWRRLVNEKRFSMRGAFSEAVSKHYPHAAIGEDYIEHLVSRGAVFPIFDGLDEICTDAFTEASVSDIVEQMESLFEEDLPGAALFTSRSTFWSDVRQSDQTRFNRFEVLPFDAHQRSAFLNGWFGEDASRRASAEQMLGAIDAIGQGRSSHGARPGLRFSQSPYVMRLVCLGASNSEGGVFDPSNLINRMDPLDGIVEAATNREIEKGGITKRRQLEILFSISLMYGDYFTVKQLREILDLYGAKDDAADGMLSHHFLANQGNMKGFLFDGLADYLRAKAFANFLFRDDDAFYGIEEYLTQVATTYASSVEIFSEIAAFYGTTAHLADKLSAPRVLKYFRATMAQGLIILLVAAARRNGGASKEEAAQLVAKTFLEGRRSFKAISFNGCFVGFDFRGFVFDSCGFNNVALKDCWFNEEVVFKRCVFDGELEVTRCDGFGLVKEDGSSFHSMASRSVFARISARDARRLTMAEDIRSVVKECFRNMHARSEVFSDISREGLASRLSQKNSYLAASVLEALEKEGAIVPTRTSLAHRARVGVGNFDDVLAFWRDGAEVGSVRRAIVRVEEEYGLR